MRRSSLKELLDVPRGERSNTGRRGAVNVARVPNGGEGGARVAPPSYFSARCLE